MTLEYNCVLPPVRWDRSFDFDGLEDYIKHLKAQENSARNRRLIDLAEEMLAFAEKKVLDLIEGECEHTPLPNPDVVVE